MRTCVSWGWGGGGWNPVMYLLLSLWADERLQQGHDYAEKIWPEDYDVFRRHLRIVVVEEGYKSRNRAPHFPAHDHRIR